jgi:hypothetical protein
MRLRGHSGWSAWREDGVLIASKASLPVTLQSRRSMQRGNWKEGQTGKPMPHQKFQPIESILQAAASLDKLENPGLR